MSTVDPGFRATLSKVEGAGEPGYCYQCSACVAECPAAQQLPDFNPREIVLASLLGGMRNRNRTKDRAVKREIACWR